MLIHDSEIRISAFEIVQILKKSFDTNENDSKDKNCEHCEKIETINKLQANDLTHFKLKNEKLEEDLRKAKIQLEKEKIKVEELKQQGIHGAKEISDLKKQLKMKKENEMTQYQSTVVLQSNFEITNEIREYLSLNLTFFRIIFLYFEDLSEVVVTGM